MRDLIKGVVIANEIRMRRTLFLGSFLLVEGDSDRKFFAGYISADECKIKSCDGKHLHDAVDELNRSGFRGFLAIADADFTHLAGGPPVKENVVWTELHDLECLLLQGFAFTKVLAEFASPEKLGCWESSSSDTLMDKCLDGACLIGSLLWESTREGLGMSFDNLNVDEFTDRRTLSVDRSLLVKHVKNKSSMHSVPDADLLASIAKIERLKADRWQLCRGHDFMELLGFSFRFAVGSQSANDVTKERLESCLRLAYPSSEFAASKLFRDIREWETANMPYVILASHIVSGTGTSPLS